jgi:hypothetical protein
MKSFAMLGICPVCNQGRLLVAHSDVTDADHVMFEDCEAVWDNPETATDTSKVLRNCLTNIRFLTLEKMEGHPWEAFVR